MNVPIPRSLPGNSAGRTATLAAAACLFVAGAVAQTAPAPDARGDDEIRIREVFSSHLPDTMRKNLFRASIHPHFGDFNRHDYFRVSNTLRYGATDHLEVSAGVDAFVSHGIGDVGLFKEVGIMAAEFGAKYNLGHHVLRDWDASVGFEERIPAGSPPAELTDGLRHFTPYTSFSRRLESRPDIRIFWGVGADLVTKTRYVGVLDKNQLGDDSVNVSAGFVIDRNLLHYSFEALFATTRGIGDGSDDDVLTLRPGIIWEIPTWRDRHKRSGWLIGLAPKVSFGPDGTDFGLSAKLRLNVDLKKLFGRKESAN